MLFFVLILIFIDEGQVALIGSQDKWNVHEK